MGRIERYKGVDTILAMAKRLPHLNFIVVGHGTYADEFSAAASKLPNIELMGVLPPEEVADEMARALCLFVPSGAETFGLISAEAMASGTPVVATAIGGIPEVVTNECGILVEVGNLDAFEHALAKLSSDPAFRAAFRLRVVRGSSSTFLLRRTCAISSEFMKK